MTPFVTALIQDVFLFSVLIGLAVYLAKKRERNIYLWGIGGIVIVPTIVLFFLPKKNKNESVSQET